jgi:uncharacterized protein
MAARRDDNAAMSMPVNSRAALIPLTDHDIERLQSLLDNLPAPLQPLDVMSLDGYLCGVLLQPDLIPEIDWWPGVLDVEDQVAPPGLDCTELRALVQRRYWELSTAIAQRQWFDPWIFSLDDEASTSEQVLPWIAGFASAMDRFPALMSNTNPALVEPLALLYLHFDPEDLDDADTLLAAIEEIEPPPDLAEAVQDIVRSLMLMADITRPRSSASLAARGHRPGHKGAPQRRPHKPSQKPPRR